MRPGRRLALAAAMANFTGNTMEGESMRIFPVILGASAACLLAGCGGSSGGGGDGARCPAGASLTLAPKPQTVAAGGGPVTFFGNLSGCSEMVAWQLTGPGSIDRTDGTPVVYTPPAAVASATPATVTITAGGLMDSATFTVNP